MVTNETQRIFLVSGLKHQLKGQYVYLPVNAVFGLLNSFLDVGCDVEV